MKISGNEILYGFAETIFGRCFLACINEKLIQLSFFDSTKYETDLFFDKYEGNTFINDDNKASSLADRIFNKNEQVALQLEGTDFQLRVWRALMEIPINSTTTYADIAQKIGKPKAVRAVGTAIGANPIAFIVPCHRVIRSNGELGGYRWGLEIKKKILAHEQEISKKQTPVRNMF